MLTRREFIKNTGILSATAAFIPSLACNVISDKNNPSNYQHFTLKGFDDELEECPTIVGDGNGQMWMFSLRRINYPLNKEIISAFHYQGNNWIETDPVTKTEGQYESPIASCANGGKPVVAWTEIDSGKWTIKVSIFRDNKFDDPYELQTNSGRAIDPILLAADKNRNWIAWENFDKGKLSICISKYEHSKWTEPLVISKGEYSCFNPAIAEAKNGDLYVAYGLSHGYHQNIEMSIIDARSFEIKKTVPIAIGGGLKTRVNLNTKPALAFDDVDRLWISYENNKNSNRLEDGDNYTGDRCCAILSYKNGKVVETIKNGKWLFSGKNDHKPTFIKDIQPTVVVLYKCWFMVVFPREQPFPIFYSFNHFTILI